MSGFTDSDDRKRAEEESAAIRLEQEKQEEKRKQDKLAILKRKLDDLKRKLDLEKQKLAELEEEARTLRTKETELSETAHAAGAAAQDSSFESEYDTKRREIERKLDEIKRARNDVETKLRVQKINPEQASGITVEAAAIEREQTVLDKLRSAHQALKERIVELTRELTQAKDDEVRMDREEREAVQEIEDLQNRQTQAREEEVQHKQEAVHAQAERTGWEEELAKHEVEASKLENELAALIAQHEEDRQQKRAHEETARQATSDANRMGTRGRENERLLNKSQADIRTLEQEIADLERQIQQLH